MTVRSSFGKVGDRLSWPDRDLAGRSAARRYAVRVMSEREVPPPERATTRTYEVRTYGCQMNVHDSERLSGLLEDAGYVRAADGRTPDVVVLNTCAVRENADNRLYGN